jgi:hypothetical protein
MELDHMAHIEKTVNDVVALNRLWKKWGKVVNEFMEVALASGFNLKKTTQVIGDILDSLISLYPCSLYCPISWCCSERLHNLALRCQGRLPMPS